MQPLTHSQQLQLLAANNALGGGSDPQYNASAGVAPLGNLNGTLAGLNLSGEAYTSDMQRSDAQFTDLDRGIFNTGLNGGFNGLPALNGLDNGFGNKLQPGMPNGVGNGYNPLNGGLGLNGDFNHLSLNGAANVNGGLDQAALAAKMGALNGAGFPNGLNSLAGFGNGALLNGMNYSGLGSMVQRQDQLRDHLQALAAADVTQLPPHLQQAYLRELLLAQQQQRQAALLGRQQQHPLPPLGAGQMPQAPVPQRMDLSNFRRDLPRELPMARQGPRNLPTSTVGHFTAVVCPTSIHTAGGAGIMASQQDSFNTSFSFRCPVLSVCFQKSIVSGYSHMCRLDKQGLDESFLLGASADLLKGLHGQRPPPPPPRMMNGRIQQPPPPPPSQQAPPNFQNRGGSAQQKKVLASLLQRTPRCGTPSQHIQSFSICAVAHAICCRHLGNRPWSDDASLKTCPAIFIGQLHASGEELEAR
jgi:hypothetical protein